jgi:signal transduction histidine kinase
VNESKLIVKSTAAAALLDNMHVVRQALSKPDGISPEQLSQRIYEWQLMMVDLVGDTVKGAELATLYEIIGVMNSSLDLTKTMGLVMDSLIHLTGAERGCLMLLDDEGDLEIQAAQNFDQQTVNPFDLKVSRTVVQEAVETRQPVLTTNAQRDPRFSGQESVVGYQLRSIVCVPLHVRERVTGALYLDNRMKDSAFSKDDLPILTAFASQAAVAIENARLHTLTEQTLAKREEELLQAEQNKASEISFVAHELRTPMTSIRGYAEMMAKGLIGPLTPDQAQFLDTIVRNTERMQILVSDVQDVTKLETHQMKLGVRATSAANALEAALQAIQPQIETRAQQVTLEIEDDLPAVQADPNRLEQILTELLRNASKYTPSAGQINVQADHHNAAVRFRIADTGIGMSPEDQDRLFVKFFRSDNPAVRNKDGTGLGLCVVKGLVELQGGEFRVESQLDQGTTCTFTMPLATKASEEADPLP